MAIIDLQERKIELIQWLSVIDDVKLLEKIVELKEQDDSDWWNEISDEEKVSIDCGLADADAGNLNPHSEARSIYEKHL